jgi:uncharacterized RmlC-like cupin family protein
MDEVTRRTLLAATAAGGVLAAAGAAEAQNSQSVPQPQRPGHGGTDPGPRNLERDRQNPDLLVPPSTDHGTLPNLRYSFSDSHVRLESGGWTRQVTVRELGVSKDLAGVNMRLNAGGVRELHWHKAAEWAYMLHGSARITAIDPQGHSFVDDVGVGDLRYLPSGIPHFGRVDACVSTSMPTAACVKISCFGIFEIEKKSPDPRQMCEDCRVAFVDLHVLSFRQLYNKRDHPLMWEISALKRVANLNQHRFRGQVDGSQMRADQFEIVGCQR